MISIRQYGGLESMQEEAMTRDDFIRQQNIGYLNRKHKKRSLCLHKDPTILPSHMGIYSSR